MPTELPVPPKKLYAQAIALDIPDKILNETYNAKYVERLLARNDMKPNNIPAPQGPKKPKVVPNMERIASTSGIKNVNWNKVRNHKVGHAKNKYEAKKRNSGKEKCICR